MIESKNRPSFICEKETPPTTPSRRRRGVVIVTNKTISIDDIIRAEEVPAAGGKY